MPSGGEPKVKFVRLSRVVLRKASHQLKLCHPEAPLRTLDAIHAASCDLSQDLPLCPVDARVRDAAVAVRSPVFPTALPV